MHVSHIRHATRIFALSIGCVGLMACATSGSSSAGAPPSTTGTHTVMGRAFFQGGIMVLLDAHIQDGRAYGSAEYSRVESAGDNTLRVSMEVQCVGLFQDGSTAIVTGPVTRSDGDIMGHIGVGDWWLIHVQEGSAEGDLISASRQEKQRALSTCHSGPDIAATIRAVDGDISIH